MSNYFQEQADKERKPVYMGPDNINGGSHWAWPQKSIRPCPGLLAPERCSLDIGHQGSCIPIKLQRAILSIDGSHACALLGENLQDGEAEFVEIVYPDGKNASDAYKHERAAAFRALYKLRERLGIEITYALGQGL